jgi:hypothetical protein
MACARQEDALLLPKHAGDWHTWPFAGCQRSSVCVSAAYKLALAIFEQPRAEWPVAGRRRRCCYPPTGVLLPCVALHSIVTMNRKVSAFIRGALLAPVSKLQMR